MVAHTYIPGTQKAEAGGFKFKTSLGYLTKKKKEEGRRGGKEGKEQRRPTKFIGGIRKYTF